VKPRFLDLPVADRLAALLDKGSAVALARPPDSGASALSVEGAIEGRRVVVLATDPSRASGAIGRADADHLVRGIAHARERRLPLVLLLDSAGAMLTEGVRVLGAFRRLERALLEFVAEDIPVAAIPGRNCFGGASLLAFAAELRLYARGARLGVSGPRSLAALQDVPVESVEPLFGADTRARHDEQSVLVTDSADALRATLRAWLAKRAPRRTLVQAQRALTRRLRMYRGNPYSLTMVPPPPELESRLDHLFPEGWGVLYGDGVIQGDGWVDGRSTSIAGFVAGRSVDAFGCWRLAEALRHFAREPLHVPVTLLLDSPGQSSAVEDEQVLLSEYIALVARAAYALRTQGRSVELWMIGEAGGAIYVALSAAAGTITGWPGLRLQTIPPRAVDRVVGKQRDTPALSALFEARVIDRWTRSPGFGEWPAPSVPPP
jgi:acetyl-CoA carboxylase alpha subunit